MEDELRRLADPSINTTQDTEDISNLNQTNQDAMVSSMQPPPEIEIIKPLSLEEYDRLIIEKLRKENKELFENAYTINEYPKEEELINKSEKFNGEEDQENEKLKERELSESEKIQSDEELNSMNVEENN